MKILNFIFVAALLATAALAIGCSNNTAFSSIGVTSLKSSSGGGGVTTTTTTTPPTIVPVENVPPSIVPVLSDAYPCTDADTDKDEGDLDVADAQEVATTYDLSAGTKKVDICHVTKGNPSNQHNICVSVNSFPARAAKAGMVNEDYFGPCKTPAPTPSPTPTLPPTTI